MIVKEIDLFKGVDFNVMNKIADICTEESYAKDIVLFKEVYSPKESQAFTKIFYLPED